MGLKQWPIGSTPPAQPPHQPPKILPAAVPEDARLALAIALRLSGQLEDPGMGALGRVFQWGEGRRPDLYPIRDLYLVPSLRTHSILCTDCRVQVYPMYLCSCLIRNKGGYGVRLRIFLGWFLGSPPSSFHGAVAFILQLFF